MSLVKITELPTSTGVNATTDYLPIVHNGVTQKITPTSLYALALTAPGPIGSVTPSTIAGTTITGVSLNISAAATVSTLTAGTSITTGNGVGTGAASIELGGLRTGSGSSFIDFHSTSGTDFESRIARNSGTNGSLDIFNAGTGNININNMASAPIVLSTAASERMRIDSIGNVGIGTTTIGARLSIKGYTTTDSATLGTEFITGGTWTSTGWTGNNTTGWAHAAGTVTALSYSVAAVAGTRYQIAYTVTRSAGSFTVAFGGQSDAGIIATGAFGPTTTNTATLVITPTTDFVGTIIVSIKAITTPSTPLINGLNSGQILKFELRVSSSINTFVGVNSGGYNTTGSSNSAMGVNALYNNTTGFSNSAMGVNALYSNTTGYNNTASGVSALYSNTTGYNNTASGVNALYNNTTGANNTASGVNALYSNTTGGSNTANGFQAGRYIANGTTALTITNNSMYLGYNTKALADNNTNETVIGYNAIGSGSNTVTLGGSAVTSTIIPYGNVGIGTSSPAAKLDIAGATNTTQLLLTFPGTNTANNYQEILFSNENVAVARSGIRSVQSYTGAYGASLAFLTENSANSYAERMRIDSSGNVGIGTNSPEVKVEVYGAGTISTSWTNGDAGGAALYLRDSGGAGGNGGQILFGANQGSFAGIKGLLINGTGPAGHLLFQTRGTSGDILERMRITSTGILQVNSDALINGVTVGKGSGNINTNTAVGLNALDSNTTGVANTSVGQSSLYTNSTGNYNTALGWYALNLSAGSGNTAVGQASLQNNTGNSNTAVGQGSLNLSTGSGNTAVGSSSGNAITTGSNNVIIGSYTGAAAPISTTGSNFIVLSDGAGNVRQTIDASGNILVATSSGAGLGYGTGTGVSVTQLTNRITATPTTGAKLCGSITLFSVAPTVGLWSSFVVPNTAIAATDNVIVSVRSGINTYIALVSAITAATSFQVSVVSILGSAIDAPIVNFTIIKSVAA